MSLPNAITREDFYLNKIANPSDDHELPDAITRQQHYLKAIAENAGGGGGGAAGSFIDTTNIITSGTHTQGMTYTATEDCFFVAEIGGNNESGAWAKIDNVTVAGCYINLSQYEVQVMLHIKAGQTVTLLSPFNQQYSYSVYGLK